MGKALWTSTGLLVPLLLLIWLAIASLWLRRPIKFPIQKRTAIRDRPNFIGTLLTSTLLLIFAVPAFYVPMQKSFWNGTDDVDMLYITETMPLSQLMAQSDRWEARPLEMFGVALARKFTDESVDSFLWLAFMLRCASALLLYGIVRCLLKTRSLALLAALLFMVNPGEPWRYIAIVMMDYYLALFLLLLSIWLYLNSYVKGNRFILLGACLALVGTFLTRESALLIAVAVPALLFLLKPRRPNRRLWLYAWIGTLALMLLRFGLFWLNTPDAYQKGISIPVGSATEVVDRLALLMSPALAYASDLSLAPRYAVPALLVAIVAGCLLWLHTRNENLKTLLKPSLFGIALTAAAIVLSILPYFGFSAIRRTQFFAAPFQAAGWTLLIALVGGLLAFRFRLVARWWLVGAGSFLIFAAVAQSFHFQDQQQNSGVSFARIVSIFDQVHRLAPVIQPGSAILFVLDDGRSPFGGRNIQLIELSRLAFGVDALQANYIDVYGRQSGFEADGIWLVPDPAEPRREFYHYPYSQAIAFRIDSSARVTLLDTLPPALLREGVFAEGYNPRSRISPGSAFPLRFLHFSHWMPYYALPGVGQ